MKTALEKLAYDGYTPTKMPKAIKTKWLKALRSGEYNKTTGTLYDDDSDGRGTPGFCCLGVLQHCVSGGIQHDSEDNPLDFPSSEWLKDWDIQDSGFNVYYDNHSTELAFLNDEQKLSFKQIANIIEKQVIGV